MTYSSVGDRYARPPCFQNIRYEASSFLGNARVCITTSRQQFAGVFEPRIKQTAAWKELYKPLRFPKKEEASYSIF